MRKSYDNMRQVQNAEEHCGDDEQLSSRTIDQCLEDDLWIRTARLNTTYIPTWNN